MSSGASFALREFMFDLNVDDGWPPVASEALQFSKVPGGNRLEVAPFFVPNLSAGDVLHIQATEEGRVLSWRHVLRSRRSTIWLKSNSSAGLEATLSALKSLGCNVERLPQFGYFALDVPAECPVEDLDRHIEALEARNVAVAYPSFRHE